MHACMQAARQNELSFFQSNPAYSGCTNIGTDFLSTKLSTQLIKAIQMQLPKITTSIDSGCVFVVLLLNGSVFVTSMVLTCRDSCLPAVGVGT